MARGMKHSTLVFLVIAALGSPLIAGDNWPRFRGDNGSGVSEDAVPTKWTDADYTWDIELPGTGHSSPVVWGDHVFVTAADDEAGKRFLVCVNAADGKILWQHDVEFKTFKKHGENSYASSTPAVDERHVYVSWTTPEQFAVVAVNHDGKEAWHADLGPYETQHGGGGSPVVVGNVVIVNVDQDKPGSFIAGLDRDSGEVKWRTPRKSTRFSTSTPCVLRPSGAASDQLVFATHASGFTALDPATGKILWELPGTFADRVVASPVAAGDLVIGNAGEGGRGKTLVAVRAPAGGDDDKPQIVYSFPDDSPYVPTTLAFKDRLFSWSDAGAVICRNLKTGEEIWKGHVKGGFFGSPICAAGKLYCTSKRGEVVVVNAMADTFEVIARNDLDEASDATPAVSKGRLFLRTIGHLICVGGSKPAEAVPAAGRSGS